MLGFHLLWKMQAIGERQQDFWECCRDRLGCSCWIRTSVKETSLTSYPPPRHLVLRRQETEQLGKAEAAVVEWALHHFVASSSNPRGQALPIFSSWGSWNTTVMFINNNPVGWELQGRGVGGLVGLFCFALFNCWLQYRGRAWREARLLSPREKQERQTRGRQAGKSQSGSI